MAQGDLRLQKKIAVTCSIRSHEMFWAISHRRPSSAMIHCSDKVLSSVWNSQSSTSEWNAEYWSIT